jgi:hypothetical protein
MKVKKAVFFAMVLLFLLPAVLAISNKLKGPKEPLEKIEFIHCGPGFRWNDELKICEKAAKLEAAKAPKPPTCYKFLTPTKVRWQTLPISYVINPTNPQNLPQEFVTSAVFNAAEEWDVHTTTELMNNAYAIDPGATYGVQDYKNAITFGNYPTEGVIAVTTVWYNSTTKEIVEFDIMFDTDWTWGNATVECSSTESFTNTTCGIMDLQNIATHEFGHGVGLNDVYDSACSEVTMYGYSDYGEIKKRTLEQPDITGLQTLYGA